MPVATYCRRETCTATPYESLRDAAKRMDAVGVGCVVVVDADQRPVGMLTDRDVALAVLSHGRDSDATAVREVMCEPVTTVTESAPLAVAVRLLRKAALRRIPVVEKETGRLTGILAVDDLVQLISNELAAVAEVARSQFPADLRGERALTASAEGS